MSYGPRPVCELRAPTVTEGLNDYQQEKIGADVIISETQEDIERAIIGALNERFVHGLAKDSVMIILPTDIHMALITIRTWKPGQENFPGVCISRTPVAQASRLLNPAEPKYSGYMFSEDKGWYVVTSENIPQDSLAMA